jgi:hypothetical protein
MSVKFSILFVIPNFLSLKKETYLLVARRQAGDEQSTCDAENCALLDCYLESKKILGFFTLKDGFPETSVRNYHYKLRNSPEKGSSCLLRGGSLQSNTTRNADKSVPVLRICDEIYTDFTFTSALLLEKNSCNVLFVICCCLWTVRSQGN